MARNAARGSSCTGRRRRRARCCSSIPGGPYWAKKDLGAWSIPKGELDGGEDPRACALREFAEETGTPAARRRAGRARRRQAQERQAGARASRPRATSTPATVDSNTFEVEWPPRSGRRQSFPEVDRAEWFGARRRAREAQPRAGGVRRPARGAARDVRMPGVGLEPTRPRGQSGLSRPRLPVTPPGRTASLVSGRRRRLRCARPRGGPDAGFWAGYPVRSNFSAPAGLSRAVPRLSLFGSLGSHPRRRRRPRALAAAAAAVGRAADHAHPARQPPRVRGAGRPLPVAAARVLPPHAVEPRGRRGRAAGGLRRRVQRDPRRRRATSTCGPWLYRIARNRSLNHLRKAQAIGVDSMDVHLSEHGLTTADKVHKREEFRQLMSDVAATCRRPSAPRCCCARSTRCPTSRSPRRWRPRCRR